MTPEEEERMKLNDAYLDGYRAGYWAGTEVERARMRETFHAGLGRMLDRMEQTRKDLHL